MRAEEKEEMIVTENIHLPLHIRGLPIESDAALVFAERATVSQNR